MKYKFLKANVSPKMFKNDDLDKYNTKMSFRKCQEFQF